ncbi:MULTISPECIES: DUF5681 domain-containing protein [unclassified Rhizobium]|uniref:DUF5681 domain-containing protein n=1 Tax=unclassified Rhizobium TaxID=2613769 RepID=UPI00115D26DA|nr:MULTISPECIES: DUF5681 domain-containing protein [unclassified Rhizobium]TQX90260.1 hypothetical protein EQW76_11190 [Rhizobium sp. rho-13.1]TQY16210.1 hypothetical protein EQW74_10780 [Rhizobium sp. rho-1.1]
MTDKPKRTRTPKQIAAGFQKGKSGNPSGRPPVPPDVVEAAKALTMEAIDTLADEMRNGKNGNSRVQAAKVLLDRGWGQAKQSVDVDVTHKQDMSSLLDMLAQWDEKKATIAAANAPLVVEHVEVRNGQE